MKAAAICIKRSQANRHPEHGVTMVLVAVAMVAIIAMAALSIDVVTLYLANAEAQRSADAGALAAARVLSVTGMTGDPSNSSAQWVNICGGINSPASQVATAVATQNTVSGISPSQVIVTYAAGGTSGSDCTGLGAPGAPFGVNPTVTVKVQRTGLPTLFSRIWTRATSNVSASATAEAFNPSNSGNVGNNGASGTLTPVRPRCVKPWVVPNIDPGNPAGCTGGVCSPFIATADGSIQNQGISLAGSGVIGERFKMVPDCKSGGPCATVGNPSPRPAANVPAGSVGPPDLQYVPGQILSSSMAVPGGCAESDFMQAIAGCDQNTAYQCGVPQGNRIDLSQINVRSDTTTGGQCLINEDEGSGQDVLDTSAFPYRIKSGNNSPLKKAGIASNTFITSSNSIASVPIFDQTGTYNQTGTTDVTIVGFLQVFINDVDDSGNIDVTVLNVAGCGNGTPPVGNPVSGASPVPVRLIQKYP
jgi:hypothetical protein